MAGRAARRAAGEGRPGDLIPALRGLARGDTLAIAAAMVGRFYDEGLTWALGLPLQELIRWHKRMGHVRQAEGPAPVYLTRPQ